MRLLPDRLLRSRAYQVSSDRYVLSSRGAPSLSRAYLHLSKALWQGLYAYSRLAYMHANPNLLTGTKALLAHGPTNAHGGVNFNRVKQNSRAAPAYQQNGWQGQKSRGGQGHYSGQSPFAPMRSRSKTEMEEAGSLPIVDWGQQRPWSPSGLRASLSHLLAARVDPERKALTQG